MTEFIINADTYLRLSKIALQPDEQHTKDGNVTPFDTSLRSVRIEQDGGVALAVATCGKLLAVECLSDCGDDGVLNVTIDPKLIAIAQAELEQSGSLIIKQAPGWTIARGSATGTMYPLNAEIIGEWPNWRDLIPARQPAKNNGAFVFDGQWIGRMGASAPSGIFVLPRCSNVDAAVVVRDTIDPNWMGVFLISDRENKQEPAEVPAWWQI